MGKHRERKIIFSLLTGGGRSDKTIPEVVFSYKPIESRLYDFGLFIKVRKKDFFAIKRAIDNSKELTEIDTAKAGYYKFLVVSDSRKTLYKAINPEKANYVFNDIKRQISKSSSRKRIGETLATIYEGMLNVY